MLQCAFARNRCFRQGKSHLDFPKYEDWATVRGLLPVPDHFASEDEIREWTAKVKDAHNSVEVDLTEYPGLAGLD
jgi:hypothetical protein